MLTSPHSGHENDDLIKAGLARLAISIIFMALTGPTTAGALSTHAGTTEIIHLQKTASQLAQKADLSIGTRGAIDTEIKKIWHFEKASDYILLAPVVIRYEGLKNRFCRLMVQKNQNSKFVSAPAEASSDNCKGIARVIYADINRVGYPDAVLKAVVPSNRYAANIVLPQVYISDSQGDYCYAGLASKALESEWDGRAQSAMATLDAEATRLGIDLMKCTSR